MKALNALYKDMQARSEASTSVQGSTIFPFCISNKHWSYKYVNRGCSFFDIIVYIGSLSSVEDFFLDIKEIERAFILVPFYRRKKERKAKRDGHKLEVGSFENTDANCKEAIYFNSDDTRLRISRSGKLYILERDLEHIDG